MLLANLEEALGTMRPPVRLVPKAGSPLCALVDRALRLLTAGRQDRFMSEYVTTIGRTIYVPSGWERLSAAERYCTLRHELVHVRQFERWTWPGMALLYLLFPVPFGFAAARAAFELQAYRESLRAMHEVGELTQARREAVLTWMVQRFTGPDYGWMWLAGGSVRRALEKTLRTLDAGRHD
jgi:hypothetical protein